MDSKECFPSDLVSVVFLTTLLFVKNLEEDGWHMGATGWGRSGGSP